MEHDRTLSAPIPEIITNQLLNRSSVLQKPCRILPDTRAGALRLRQGCQPRRGEGGGGWGSTASTRTFGTTLQPCPRRGGAVTARSRELRLPTPQQRHRALLTSDRYRPLRHTPKVCFYFSATGGWEKNTLPSVLHRANFLCFFNLL